MPDMLQKEITQVRLAPAMSPLSNSTSIDVLRDMGSVKCSQTQASSTSAAPHRRWPSIRLSQVETRLVTHLMEAGDRWLTALDLARQVMGRDDPNGEILVRQYVFRLRKRIEADGVRIEHVRTRGYRIVADPIPVSMDIASPRGADAMPINDGNLTQSDATELVTRTGS